MWVIKILLCSPQGPQEERALQESAVRLCQHTGFCWVAPHPGSVTPPAPWWAGRHEDGETWGAVRTASPAGLPTVPRARCKHARSQFLLAHGFNHKPGPAAARDDNHQLPEPKCIGAFASLEISWLFNICTDFSLHLLITPLMQI